MRKDNDLLKYALKKETRINLVLMLAAVLSIGCFSYIEKIDADKIQIQNYEELFKE